jgi:hypothetical protein
MDSIQEHQPVNQEKLIQHQHEQFIEFDCSCHHDRYGVNDWGNRYLMVSNSFGQK